MTTKSRTRSIVIWTAVELVLETRGREHADRVMDAMRRDGYPAQPLE